MEFKNQLNSCAIVFISFLILFGLEATTFAQVFEYPVYFQNGGTAIFSVQSSEPHEFKIQYSPKYTKTEDALELPTLYEGKLLSALETSRFATVRNVDPLFLKISQLDKLSQFITFVANSQRMFLFQDGTVVESCSQAPKPSVRANRASFIMRPVARLIETPGPQAQKLMIESYKNILTEISITTLLRVQDSQCIVVSPHFYPNLADDDFPISIDNGILNLGDPATQVNLDDLRSFLEIPYRDEKYHLSLGTSPEASPLNLQNSPNQSSKTNSTNFGETFLVRARDGKKLKIAFEGWSQPRPPMTAYTIEDGILSVADVAKKIDLDHFDAEIRHFNRIRKAEPVRDEREQLIPVVKTVQSEYLDLVADSRNHPESYLEQVNPQLMQDIGEAIRSKKAVVILGKAGTGKTSAIKAFAREVGLGNIPGLPRTLEIFQVKMSHLESGTRYTGMIGKRVATLIGAAQENGSLFFIDEIHTMSGVGTNTNDPNDITQSFKGPIEARQMILLGTDTTHEFNRTFGKDRAFYERFEQITFDAPEGSQLVKLLQMRTQAEIQKDLDPEIALEAIRLSSENALTTAQPRAAVNLLQKAFTRLESQSGDNPNESRPMTRELLREVSQDLYKFDPAVFKPEIAAAKLKKLKQTLNEIFIGQTHAKKAIYDLWARHLTQTGSPEQVNSVILAGPSGIGKTRLARAAAEVMGYNYSVIEMNRFSGRGRRGDAVEDFRNQIYQALLKNTHHVLILDEFDTADNEVQNSILSMIDQGEFTVNVDFEGGRNLTQEVNARNAVFLLTSNAGADFINSNLDRGQEHPTDIDSIELKRALERDGISKKVLSRIVQVAPMTLPTQREFITALSKTLTKTLARESEKSGVTFALSRPEQFIENAKRLYSPTVDYRVIQSLMVEIESLIATEKLKPNFKEQKTILIEVPEYRVPKRPYLSLYS